MRPIYLDNAASTPVEESVWKEMQPFLAQEYGNPSTKYGAGVRAAEALERARRKVRRALAAEDHRIVFTGSGTEANNLAVQGAARHRGPGAIFVGATEHASVRVPAKVLCAEGHSMQIMPLTERGELDQAKALEAIGPDTNVVAHMLVNNEVGTLYDIPGFFAAVRKKAPGAHLHVDCIQALGKMDLDLLTLGADSLSISAHKVHGPKGAGALIVRKDARIAPLILGGPHEDGLRAGTENIACIVGLAEAVEQAVDHQDAFRTAARTCRQALEAGLADLPGFFARPSVRSVDSILSVQVPGAPGEVWQHHLEPYGIEVGIGSACQSKSGEKSPALKALGLADEETQQVLRVSFSRHSRLEDVQELVRALHELAPRLAEVPA